MNAAGQYVDSSSYIENAQVETEELSEGPPSYAEKAKKAVATAVGGIYLVTQLGCAVITHSLGISEEGKLYKEVNAMSTWPEPGWDNYLAPRFDELNQAAYKNKYNLDSLKVYKKAAEYLRKAKESHDNVMTIHDREGIFVTEMRIKKAEEIRRNPILIILSEKLYGKLDNLESRELDNLKKRYDGCDYRLKPYFNELNEAVDRNKANLDSLKVYQAVGKHLINANNLARKGMLKEANKEFKKARTVRHNPKLVLKAQPKIKPSK